MKRCDAEPFRSQAEIIASNRKRREDMLAELSRKAARAKYNAERCLNEGRTQDDTL